MPPMIVVAVGVDVLQQQGIQRPAQPGGEGTDGEGGHLRGDAVDPDAAGRFLAELDEQQALSGYRLQVDPQQQVDQRERDAAEQDL
jgi:hypothetical protein